MILTHNSALSIAGRGVVSAALAFALVLCPSASHAQDVWNELFDGDLSGDPNLPTPIALGIGSNVLTGSMSAPDDIRDYVTFTLPPGQELAALLLLQYEDLDVGGPGNRGYHALNTGSTSFIPDVNTADFFLGGAHLDPAPVGTDLLPILATAPQNGTGFAIPLGAGSYSYVIQQTGPEMTGYSLDFVVVPEPHAVCGLMMLLVCLLLSRRTGFKTVARLSRL